MHSHDRPPPSLKVGEIRPTGAFLGVLTEPYGSPSTHCQMQMARSGKAAGWIADARSDRQYQAGTPARYTAGRPALPASDSRRTGAQIADRGGVPALRTPPLSPTRGAPTPGLRVAAR